MTKKPPKNPGYIAKAKTDKGFRDFIAAKKRAERKPSRKKTK